MAAKKLERNFTLQYMRRWAEISVDVSAVSQPHVISLAGISAKQFDRVAIVDAFDDEGRLFDLRKIDPRQRTTRRVSTAATRYSPTAYWLDGWANLVLDVVPSEDYVLEINYVQLTEWGTADAWTHWLLDQAEDLLLAETLMLMSIYNRDERTWQMQKLQRDEALRTLDIAEQELQNANTETYMEYSPAGIGDLIIPGQDR